MVLKQTMKNCQECDTNDAVKATYRRLAFNASGRLKFVKRTAYFIQGKGDLIVHGATSVKAKPNNYIMEARMTSPDGSELEISSNLLSNILKDRLLHFYFKLTLR